MPRKQPFNIIDAVLIVAIIGLSVLLVYIIWEPGQALAKMENYKWESRSRMNALRVAQQQYYGYKQTYTEDVDSLITFVQDSIPKRVTDSIFTDFYQSPFGWDSLKRAPLSLKPYEIQIDDTSKVARYVITDPDGFGYIGSLTDPDQHNRASWEQ